MAVKISPNSQTFPFLEEHSDNSYKYVKSSGTVDSPSTNKCNANTSHGPAVAKTDNEARRHNTDKTGNLPW